MAFFVINTDVGAFCATKTASGCVYCYVFLSGEWVVWSEEACAISQHARENIQLMRSIAHSHSLSIFSFFLVCNLTSLMCSSGRGRKKNTSFQRPQTG